MTGVSLFSVVLSSGQVTSSQGLYNLTMEQVVDEETLEGPTTFECQVTIPDTEVQVLRSTLYQPSRYPRTCPFPALLQP